MKLLKKEWLQLLILAVPLCAAALFWNQLPPRMASHWDAAGHVNGYSSKAFAVGVPMCLNIGLTLLAGFLPLIDPRLRASDEETRANMWRVARTMRLGITAFISLITLAVIAVGIHLKINMIMLSTFCSAGLFVLMGNSMTKLRPNSFIGIRTRWTLESKDVWIKTHRLAGRIMVMGGLLLMALSLVLLSWLLIVFVFLPLLALMTLVPAVYSYRLYKKQKGA
jgi:uncharacterized membrane protein